MNNIGQKERRMRARLLQALKFTETCILERRYEFCVHLFVLSVSTCKKTCEIVVDTALGNIMNAMKKTWATVVDNTLQDF